VLQLLVHHRRQRLQRRPRQLARDGVAEAALHPVEARDRPLLVEAEGLERRAVQRAQVQGDALAGGVLVHELGAGAVLAR
jgi:hypothetical protein